LSLLPLVTSLALTLAAQRETAAGGFTNLDFGARRVAMRAVVAHPDDATAIVHNPAALTLLEGTQVYAFSSANHFETGLRLYDSQGVLRPDHNVEPDRSFGVAPFLGAVSNLGSERFRLGLALYSPNVYGAALPDDEPTRYHTTEALFVATRGTVALAYQATERVSLGASLHLVHVYLTGSRVLSPLVLQDPDRRFDPVWVTRHTDIALEITGQDITWAWDLAVLFRPRPNLYLGGSFSSGSAASLEGDVRLDYPDGVVETSRHTTKMAIPFTLRAGASWEFAPDFELSAEVIWWHYQVYQEQRTTLASPIMGMGEMVAPANYGNSWAWCLGLLYRVVSDLELMLGFQRDYTPIPSETLSLENPGQDWLSVSGGLRWQVNDDLRLGLAASRKWYELIEVQDSQTTPPTNIKGYAAMSAVAVEVGWLL
jgi:long-chain fatty acid transport protein